MQKIRVDFCDFSPNFSKTDNYFARLLSKRFSIELCDQPDFLFYGPYGHEHRLHSGIRVFLCGEPLTPDFRECDYAITCRRLDDARHFYMPQYYHYADTDCLVKGTEPWEALLAAKDRFCAFVVSNHSRTCANRLRFFERLSRYRRVDSGGRIANNIGVPIPGGSAGKIRFLKQYKFTIAYENSAHPGYVSEKLVEPMLARSLPIYWGAPDVSDHFDTASFLNSTDFPTEDALVERIMDLDQNDSKYIDMMRRPYFHENRPNRFLDPTRVLDFCDRLFGTVIDPVARRRRRIFSFGRWLLVKRHHWHPLCGESS